MVKVRTIPGLLFHLSNNILAPVSEISERLFDLESPTIFILRPGDIAWYDGSKTSQEWRLGVVTSRHIKENEPEYTIQPLANPEENLDELNVNEKHIRIFLAWSVPDTSAALPGVLFHEEVNWSQELSLRRQQNPNASCVIDSSILAAKQVDASYSLFNKAHVDVELRALETAQTHYTGMFLGSEKLWVGEAVRLLPSVIEGSKIQVLVIRQMVEKTPVPVTAQKKRSKSPPKPVDSKPVLHLVGDVYELVKRATPRAEGDWDKDDLPQRMVDDVKWLNQCEKGLFSDWQVILRDTVKGLEDIAGRWYPTKILGNNLRGSAKIQEELRSGSVSDIGLYLNHRMHQKTTENMRRRNRKHALGTSVPDTCRISRGLDEPTPEPMDLDPQ